jgi:hypothetical protein
MKMQNNFFIISLIAFACHSLIGMDKTREREIKLIEHVKANNEAEVAQLLQDGVNPNMLSEEMHAYEDPYEEPSILSGYRSKKYYAVSKSALIIAVRESNAAIVELLLKHGADPNSNENGFTCLHYAPSSKDSLEKVKLLLQYKANIHAETPTFSDSPLTYSAGFRSSETIPLLLSAGAHINHKNSYHHTALYNALCARCKKDTLLLLTNKIQAPAFTYGQNNEFHIFHHARYLEVWLSQQGLFVTERAQLRAIGRALIEFEGLYTHRRRIARRGLAQKLPVDVVKLIAMHCEYPSLTE